MSTAPLRMEIAVEDEAVVTRVSMSPEGTEPSAYVLIVVNTNTPNSLHEFTLLSTIFVEEFIALQGASMGRAIAKMGTHFTPDQVVEIEEEIVRELLLQGLAEDEAREVARKSRPF